MSFKPKIIEGNKGKQARYVCPFCGDSFNLRYINEPGEGTAEKGMSLQKHWLISATCSNNRNMNNPTQSKYDTDADT